MTPVVLALGANLDDPLAHLQVGISMLNTHSDITVTAVSPVFSTKPVGGPQQPNYLNIVATVETTLTPDKLLAVCHAVEATEGRVRNERWGPRTLDIDVIMFGQVQSDDPRLTLPHPRAHQRAFVLVPWLALNPDAVLNGSDGGLVKDLVLAAPDFAGISQTSDEITIS